MVQSHCQAQRPIFSQFKALKSQRTSISKNRNMHPNVNEEKTVNTATAMQHQTLMSNNMNWSCFRKTYRKSCSSTCSVQHTWQKRVWLRDLRTNHWLPVKTRLASYSVDRLFLSESLTVVTKRIQTDLTTALKDGVQDANAGQCTLRVFIFLAALVVILRKAENV